MWSLSIYNTVPAAQHLGSKDDLQKTLATKMQEQIKLMKEESAQGKEQVVQLLLNFVTRVDMDGQAQ